MTAIEANTINGLGGRLKSLGLGGTIGCWLPNTYGIGGSLETDSIVTTCGSGEATEEIVIVSITIAPDSCVKLRIAGVLFRAGLLSSDERSTKKHRMLWMKNPKREVCSSHQMIRD